VPHWLSLFAQISIQKVESHQHHKSDHQDHVILLLALCLVHTHHRRNRVSGATDVLWNLDSTREIRNVDIEGIFNAPLFLWQWRCRLSFIEWFKRRTGFCENDQGRSINMLWNCNGYNRHHCGCSLLLPTLPQVHIMAISKGSRKSIWRGDTGRRRRWPRRRVDSIVPSQFPYNVGWILTNHRLGNTFNISGRSEGSESPQPSKIAFGWTFMVVSIKWGLHFI
jgi:hypothetical protein